MFLLVKFISFQLSSSDHLVMEDEECGKTMELTPTVHIMLSWGKTCLLEWKDCLPAHLQPTPDYTNNHYLSTLLPSLTDLLEHTKEHDHYIEWRHIDTTLCVWLSWIHVNDSDMADYNVFITDNGPVCTRAFRGIKTRTAFGSIQLMHFNLLRDLPWVSTLTDIQGKQVNISIVCNNSPLQRWACVYLCVRMCVYVSTHAANLLMMGQIILQNGLILCSVANDSIPSVSCMLESRPSQNSLGSALQANKRVTHAYTPCAALRRPSTKGCSGVLGLPPVSWPTWSKFVCF